MKAIILCGGMGTRLREFTELRPKPMVELGGRPILWHIMKLYAHHSITEFILCLGYKGSMIKDYFLNYEAMNNDFTVELGRRGAVHLHGSGHKEIGWKVTLADTGERAMTGARIKRVAQYLADDPTFAVTYGDGVSDVDLRRVLAFHQSHGGLATITGVRPPSRFGDLEVSGTRVVAFREKQQIGQGIISGGFFFFQREILDYLTDDESCILEREPLERTAAAGQLHVYEHPGYWQCMDNLRDWEYLQSQWESGKAPWKVWA
jgi:glucose-1-phosphate cytidylyltransferase